MINLQFSIRNPFSQKFRAICSWAGTTPFKFKFWEFEIYQDSSLISVGIEMTMRQSHAGASVEMGVLGYCVRFAWYDGRHWIAEANTWQQST